MGRISRIGVSINTSLLAEFDGLIRKMGYANRSEAFRDLIRDKLVTEEWKGGNAECVGVVSIVYDHHRRDISDRLIELQHEFGESIISSTHIHLDRDNCLEVVIARDGAAVVKEIADRLIGSKGVKHGKLAMTSTGRGLR
ncbi:MAG: nickel-responsive transcriptional regulator NikR [Deltaproteobacteria bacterium]|nr:nickel-responsive transcriptional regulator NikR [Deltaproteobacteria bacterium]NIS78249.1 nickel-responsive transcriptional regulator NikR [Deltaproteobacteria bacterium]